MQIIKYLVKKKQQKNKKTLKHIASLREKSLNIYSSPGIM